MVYRCAVVYPRRGAFAVFDGGLGHGVLGSAAPGLRATLLINWWPHQPQVCCNANIKPHLSKCKQWMHASAQLGIVARGRDCYSSTPLEVQAVCSEQVVRVYCL